ncbi:EAL domain-containing protein [Deinococcus sp. Leaf326]|jgi:diguanylate cyclase (GGDEF)-like protein|uniref:sensor domain-containing protein n=1 Tax=Deinococcus sp. Leaf326 TaxID=1736338 RepID=UPI000A537A7D|nr:EAL domain-containing protein [Deinococcus sp. Leaf326]
MSASLATDPALHLALRDLMRVHAPEATLLASAGEGVVRVEAGAVQALPPGAELLPPDHWLDHGELVWLTQEGALLGLLWSAEQVVSPAAVQVLTVVLAAARGGQASREADLLITQLPAATAWLSSELTFRQVSRSFLELFGLSGAAVVGATLESVFPSAPDLRSQLSGAASGHAVQLRDELLLRGEARRWVRGEAKPYFGGAVAGVLWTVQDVTPEYVRAGEVSALLDTELPLALLGPGGVVVQASRGFMALRPGGAPAEEDQGAPLWTWPSFASQAESVLRGMLRSAQAGETVQADVPLVGGQRLSFTARPSPFTPDLVVLQGPPEASGTSSAVVSQVLSLSGAATILLDAGGRAQLISEQAASLLDLNGAQLTGTRLSKVLQQLGVRLATTTGQPLLLDDVCAPQPEPREILITLPGGVTRQLELRVTAVDSAGKKPSVLLALRDVSALRHAQAKLRHASQHDPLTGLANRAGLRALLSEVPAGPGTVVCLDVDAFGALNAALGRTAGDLLLIQVAARLNDLAALHGGRAARLADDTFALFLPGVRAEVGAQKVQAALREPLRAGQRVVPVTFAVGAAMYGEGATEQALADADVALQHARRRGRAQTLLFAPELRDDEALDFRIEEDLRGAATAGQFTLLYQPVVSLKNGRALGAEALLRWTHPELGNISPTRFLPIASRSDLITGIGEWVVREALSGRSAVREATGRSDWRTSVNLSLEELRRPGASQRLLPLMARHHALDIEVSAGSLTNHSEETLGLLGGLRARGAQLVVDDFGDGASSLTALTQFPLSGLKLHPTLTAQLPGDERSLRLVQGTVDLAHSLGLQVTAVGVETYTQLDILRDLGCDAAQGYAIAPALSAPDLAEWVRSR